MGKLPFRPIAARAKKGVKSDLADVLAILPDRLEGGQIPGVENVAGGVDNPAAFEGMPGVADIHGDVLKDAGVAIAVDHAPGATVADQLRGVEIVDAAHGGFPEMAAVQVQVPVQVEVLMPAKTAEAFLFTT